MRQADTHIIDPVDSGPRTRSFCTKGITAPGTAYFRLLYTDAVRAVDALRDAPQVDPARIVVSGASQAGGLGLVAALPDVLFMCHFHRVT